MFVAQNPSKVHQIHLKQMPAVQCDQVANRKWGAICPPVGGGDQVDPVMKCTVEREDRGNDLEHHGSQCAHSELSDSLPILACKIQHVVGSCFTGLRLGLTPGRLVRRGRAAGSNGVSGGRPAEICETQRTVSKHLIAGPAARTLWSLVTRRGAAAH